MFHLKTLKKNAYGGYKAKLLYTRGPQCPEITNNKGKIGGVMTDSGRVIVYRRAQTTRPSRVDSGAGCDVIRIFWKQDVTLVEYSRTIHSNSARVSTDSDDGCQNPSGLRSVGPISCANAQQFQEYVLE